MSTLIRPAGGSLSEILQWLDLNRPSSMSDLVHYIPIETFAENGTYKIRADLPGVDPDKDIEVKVDGDVLTIHGQRREVEHDEGHSEVRYGEFTRSMRLPSTCRAQDVVARYDAGVLEVSVPMDEAASKPLKIAVQRGES